MTICHPKSRRIFLVQFIFHKRHTCLSTLGEREKECPPDINYCELRSPHYLLTTCYMIANFRLRIRNQNKYYHNRGRADGLSGWPQNYEVNFRGCGTPYQTQGDRELQLLLAVVNYHLIRRCLQQ